MWLGPAMLPGQFWFVIAFCFFYWIYYERIMFAEEQFLRKKFGADYLDWAGKVPVFIPDFNKYIKPKLSFSWRKVIKQEKSGLLALFFIFFAFDIVGELIESETDFNYFIIVGFVFSLVYYLTIKILRKRTTLLDVKEQ
jgi:hypothetical protein